MSSEDGQTRNDHLDYRDMVFQIASESNCEVAFLPNILHDEARQQEEELKWRKWVIVLEACRHVDRFYLFWRDSFKAAKLIVDNLPITMSLMKQVPPEFKHATIQQVNKSAVLQVLSNELYYDKDRLQQLKADLKQINNEIFNLYKDKTAAPCSTSP